MILLKSEFQFQENRGDGTGWSFLLQILSYIIKATCQTYVPMQALKRTVHFVREFRVTQQLSLFIQKRCNHNILQNISSLLQQPIQNRKAAFMEATLSPFAIVIYCRKTDFIKASLDTFYRNSTQIQYCRQNSVSVKNNHQISIVFGQLSNDIK